MRGFGKPIAVLLLSGMLAIAGCDGPMPETVPPSTATTSPTPAVSATATSSLAPTPTVAPTPTPTQRPTTQPTPTATPTATPSPTIHLRPTPVPPSTPPGPIDVTLPPQDGAATFQPGVTGDPDLINVAMEGSIDAAYVGGGCGGTVSAAPQLRIDFVGPSTTGLLRFYFDGTGDPTLLVRTPDGQWLCNDDSYNGSDPTVDITDPAALAGNSSYLVWVGSYAGNSLLGTLYITALDSNHP